MHWIQDSFFKKILRMRDREERFRVCLDCAYFCWNWKYCSEIIFKCVNSAVGPIFNKKLLKSVICGTVNSAQCTYALFTVDKVNYCRLNQKKKKKKEKNVEEKHIRHFHCNPNSHLRALWRRERFEGRNHLHPSISPPLYTNVNHYR